MGDPLVSNCRRPIMTLIEDSSLGIHDTLMTACDLYRYLTLDHHGCHDNCADNLRLAMAAIGLGVEWLAPTCKPGDHVVLHADMDYIVGAFNLPIGHFADQRRRAASDGRGV